MSSNSFTRPYTELPALLQMFRTHPRIGRLQSLEVGFNEEGGVWVARVTLYHQHPAEKFMREVGLASLGDTPDEAIDALREQLEDQWALLNINIPRVYQDAPNLLHQEEQERIGFMEPDEPEQRGKPVAKIPRPREDD